MRKKEIELILPFKRVTLRIFVPPKNEKGIDRQEKKERDKKRRREIKNEIERMRRKELEFILSFKRVREGENC